MLGKIENATRYPTLDLAERCDLVLECGGALVRLFGLLDAHRIALKPRDDVAVLMGRLMRAVAGIPEPAARGAAELFQQPGTLLILDPALHGSLSKEVRRFGLRCRTERLPTSNLFKHRIVSHRLTFLSSVYWPEFKPMSASGKAERGLALGDSLCVVREVFVESTAGTRR